MSKTTKEIYNEVRDTCAASDEFKELMKKEWVEKGEIQEPFEINDAVDQFIKTLRSVCLGNIDSKNLEIMEDVLKDFARNLNNHNLVLVKK